MYLPPNTTALIQPMDQGVLEAMKRRYRKAMLRKLLLEDQEGRSIVDFVKKIDIKQVVYMIASAWDDVSSLTIAKSWHNLLGSGDNCGENQPNVQSTETSQASVQSDDQSTCEMLIHELDGNLTNEDVSSWLNSDSSDPGYQLLSDDEIIDSITTHIPDDDGSDEEEDESDTQETPTCGAVAEMLDKCLVWYEQQKESMATSLLMLKNIRDLAATKRYSNLKQLTLLSFTK